MSIILGRWHRLLHVRALLAKRNGGEQEICPVHHGSPLDSQLLHKERATPRAPLREEAMGSRVLHREFAQEEMQEKVLLGYPRPVHPRREVPQEHVFVIGRNEEICREMDKLADEDHTHHITPEEIRVYKNIWWIRSNTVGSDMMPVRHRPDLKQALSTLRQLKNQEDTAHQQRWQSYSSSWWNWQESWWHSSYEHHHEDVPSTD